MGFGVVVRKMLDIVILHDIMIVTLFYVFCSFVGLFLSKAFIADSKNGFWCLVFWFGCSLYGKKLAIVMILHNIMIVTLFRRGLCVCLSGYFCLRLL